MPGTFYGLVASHGLFVLCGATYFAYWALQELAPGPAAVLLFFVSLLLGFGGALSSMACVLAATAEGSGGGRGGFGLGRVVGACVALLVGAYVATSVVWDRPFTSELVFLMIWATVELCALRVAHGSGWLVGGMARAALIAVLLALAVGLACYTVYFVFEGRARFCLGLAPYAVVSIAMAVAGILLWRGRGIGYFGSTDDGR